MNSDENLQAVIATVAVSAAVAAVSWGAYKLYGFFKKRQSYLGLELLTPSYDTGPLVDAINQFSDEHAEATKNHNEQNEIVSRLFRSRSDSEVLPLTEEQNTLLRAWQLSIGSLNEALVARPNLPNHTPDTEYEAAQYIREISEYSAKIHQIIETCNQNFKAMMAALFPESSQSQPFKMGIT